MTSAKPRAQWSLRHELTRVLVVAALLPAMVFGVALLWSQWQRDQNDLLLRLGANAQLSANAFDDFLEGQLAGLRLLADDDAANMDDRNAELARLLRAYPAMRRAMVSDGDGHVVAARAVQAPDARALVAPSPQGDAMYRVLRVDGQPQVSLSVPLSRDGHRQGRLYADIPVDRFTRERSQNLRLRGFELLLLDGSGRVVHASKGVALHSLDDAGAIGLALRAEATPAERTAPARSHEGLLRDGGAAFVNTVRMRIGWTVAVIAPEQRLLAPSLPRLLFMLGLLAVAMLGALLALWRMRRLLASSLGRLVASLHGYALGGTLDPRQLTRMPEELQPLASGIGDLAARMNAAFGELREVLDQREHAIADRTRELSDAVTELDRLSRTDALTGSLNYRGFQEQALRVWEAADDRCEALAVLAIDIDHFKAYNDRYGHLQGDNALRRFAGTVRSALLHADDVLARQGGEEFAVLLPGATEVQARAVAARIRERLREADIAHAGSPSGRMTASIGIATMPAGAPVALGTLLTQADAALYRAKTAGRDRAEV